jgi:hypothetical protein
MPASEVRHLSQHPLRRTSEAKGTSKYLILVPLIDLKFLKALAAGDTELQIGGTSLSIRSPL